MRNRLLAGRFSFLSQIVQEEIDQNGVHRSLGVLLDDLPANELDTPDTVATKLDLPRMSRWDRFVVSDSVVKRWAI